MYLVAAAAVAAPPKRRLTCKERIDRVLKGEQEDHVPFSFWHHFDSEKFPPERFAKRTLAFHKQFRTDLVKVMSDYPYPKPEGDWYRLKVEDNPFPEQIRALELIRDGLREIGSGVDKYLDAYFVETIFNPYNQAEKLSSKEEVAKLRREKPQALLDALDVISRSEANHARRAIAAGASGIFLAIDNANEGALTREEYAKFCEPFDRRILEAVSGAPLNTLHIHGEKVYLDFFYRNWPARILNYSVHASGIPMKEVRKHYGGVLMGGVDEIHYRMLSDAELIRQFKTAIGAAGRRFILAPGCSVPKESGDIELTRFPNLLGA